MRERVTTITVSIAVHAVLGALLARTIVEHVQDDPELEYVEIEVVPPAREPPPAPIAPVPPAATPEPIPTARRPERVPDKVAIKQVDRALPFQSDAVDVGERDAPDDAEAVPAPTAVPIFDMESALGGGGEYETTSAPGGEVPVAARGAGVGAAGPTANQGAADVRVARDWQVTELPEPLNDDAIEPDYPPLARREGREAVVVLRLTVDSTGKVVEAIPIRGPRDHGFRESAIAFGKRLRFRPARAGSRTVASRIEWSVYFHVRN